MMAGVPDLNLFDAKRGLYFAPIRHHSPTCAWHLKALINEVKPRQILIECPIDFDPLIPVLLDSTTRPPVAIVAFSGSDKDQQRQISYYPFSSHAPEYVALCEGRRLGARLGFIDLPAGIRLGWRYGDSRPDTLALSFADERTFDTSTYTRALCERTGCRDQNELWDHLFETRLGGRHWRAFFTAVGAYCASVRATVSTAQMTDDGTVAREQHMAERIAHALPGAGPIVIVTGGFHTPALIDAGRPLEPKPARLKAERDRPAAQSYVIRYSFVELDRLNGYAAGLPSPLYYERLWHAAADGVEGGQIWRSVAADTLTAFATHLRSERPGLTPSLPALTNALEHASQLADLRGRPGPTRQDLLDAAQSCFVKDEIGFGLAPVLGELQSFLTGEALGDVPASAGSPPLVETVRAGARRLGFELDFTSRKKRELDIYRSERHQQASRFLHAMTFIGTEFAARISGPDFLHGVSEDLLYETWTVAWSPMVEARLIDLSPLGDSIEMVAGRLLQQRIEAMRDDANTRGASVAVQLLFTVCQIGLQNRAGEIWPIIEGDIAADADLASVTRALSELFLLWRARSVLGMVGSRDAERLIGIAYRRALHLLENLKDTKEERYRDVLSGLATLREVINSAKGEVASIDPDLFHEAVERRLNDALAPALAGAIAALAHLSGSRGTDILVDCVRGHMEGAYLSPADNVAALNGMLTIAPELVWRVPELLTAIDGFISKVDEERFTEQLPHLRLAFSKLNPRETDEIAVRLAARHEADAVTLRSPVTYGISENELQANLMLSEKVRASLAADGLADWPTAREPQS
jgi:hypothetical protein